MKMFRMVMATLVIGAGLSACGGGLHTSMAGDVNSDGNAGLVKP